MVSTPLSDTMNYNVVYRYRGIWGHGGGPMGINGIYHKYMYNYNGWSKFFWLFIFLNKISSSGSLTNFTRSLSYSSLFSTRSLATLVLATAEYQAAADYYNVYKGNNQYVDPLFPGNYNREWNANINHPF